ncbi:serine/threonine protein kinase [Colletotrichum orchidophilum]|uniref:Serine/threonine protein kinase n=1 Tax=Colletotrichum orchidophilum TaxID=1209926 RepID=A0A1G4AVJ2_9PEZI|nr:serine/threonine protein kinase [Colletotrichum orchidophilum]OHE93116.1 serine/threonine protein kinase [Colletotrichum orchidophilum]
MDQANDTCSADLFDWLRLCSNICARLEAWAGKLTSKPLITLAQELIRELTTTTRAFEHEINCISHPIGSATEPEDQYCWPLSVLEAANRVYHCIELALSILSYSNNFEPAGDEGALNALFFVLGGRTRNSDDASRARLGQEVLRALSPWFGPLATQNCYWGLDQSHPCITPNTAIEINEVISTCLQKTFHTFSPRYVHTYPTRGDIPYVIDPSVNACAGSFGIVRKVHEKITRKSYAEKTYRNLFSGKERKAVLNELGVLEICCHPNIVTLVDAYEVVDEPHTINIVMSPWAPVTLHEFLYTSSTKRKEHFPWFKPDQPISDRRVYDIMLRLTEALAYLHGLSIKHKDIKPDNILLHTEGDEVTPYITWKREVPPVSWIAG